MNLRDELAAVNPTIGGLTCTVCDYINTLPKEDAQALTDALQDRRYHATMIHKAITNTNCHTVSVGSIRRHRRGECAGTKDSG